MCSDIDFLFLLCYVESLGLEIPLLLLLNRLGRQAKQPF